MKHLSLILLFCYGAISFLNAQPFSVPEITPVQKQEILYNHVIGYAVTGISFAKTKGTTPEEFGKFIGTQFKSYWNPDDGFPVFANGLIYILAGMHPDNEMQIVEQNESMVRFKLKNVDFMFRSGSAFGVSYAELMECSYGIISVLAEHMKTSFSHNMTDDGWYVATIKKK